MTQPISFFTKDQVKQRAKQLMTEYNDASDPNKYTAGLNLALLIASSALFSAKVWSGKDYATHYLNVAMHNTDSYRKMIIGILHDVVEDSDWTLEDLKEVGFSDEIIAGVDGVTKRDGEKYFDFIVRCGQSGNDCIDVKLKDLRDNLRGDRLIKLPEANGKAELKRRVYVVCYNYLVSMKKREIGVGMSIRDYMIMKPGLSDPALLKEFGNDRPKPQVDF